MVRVAFAAFVLALAAGPALAQAPAAPAQPAPAQSQGGKDVPFAKLMGDGAQVKAVDSKDRVIVQLGKYVFACRPEAGKPYLCDQLL